MVATRKRRTTSKTVSYVSVDKFAGISAQRDKVAMSTANSPMARNVNWYPPGLGGFQQRKGVGPLPYGNTGGVMASPPHIPIRFAHYLVDPNVPAQIVSQYLIATDEGSVYIGVDQGPAVNAAAPGTWTPLSIASVPFASIGAPVFAAWDTKMYLTLGSQTQAAAGLNMVRYDGQVAAKLGTAYVDDYAAPTGGNMPRARFATAWQERMWVACTIEGSTLSLNGSRVRFSHPAHPEDWATDDWIDVGQAGSTITGLAPMRDMLLVFKANSTYAVLGSGTSNFRVVEVSGMIGCNGAWTRDNQGAVVFWDGTLGLCRFDGSQVVNLFQPLTPFISEGAITRCGGIVGDGEMIYVLTDFMDYYGDRVADPAAGVTLPLNLRDSGPLAATPILQYGSVTWQQLATAQVTWESSASQRWQASTPTFYNMVWVYRDGAGWTSYVYQNPSAAPTARASMLGQVRSRVDISGAPNTNRRIVIGKSDVALPISMNDVNDDGYDHWGGTATTTSAIDSFYMTPWLHGGLPAQIKRWKAPRVIQEADQEGNLLIDVYYDFNYANLRRTLKVGFLQPLTFDSYSVGKPGTIGRAKAVMLVIRPEAPRHWGVSSLVIPLYPKVMR